MVNIQLRGDWRKLRTRINRMESFADEMMDDVMENIAQIVENEVHQVVNSNPPPVNAPRTAKKKGHNRSLEETGGMGDNNSVITVVEKAGDRNKYTVKGNPEKAHSRKTKKGVDRNDGINYEEILSILENGDDKIPGRHSFAIAYNNKRKQIERSIISQAKKHLMS